MGVDEGDSSRAVASPMSLRLVRVSNTVLSSVRMNGHLASQMNRPFLARPSGRSSTTRPVSRNSKRKGASEVRPRRTDAGGAGTTLDQMKARKEIRLRSQRGAQAQAILSGNVSPEKVGKLRRSSLMMSDTESRRSNRKSHKDGDESSSVEKKTTRRSRKRSSNYDSDSDNDDRMGLSTAVSIAVKTKRLSGCHSSGKEVEYRRSPNRRALLPTRTEARHTVTPTRRSERVANARRALANKLALREGVVGPKKRRIRPSLGGELMKPGKTEKGLKGLHANLTQRDLDTEKIHVWKTLRLYYKNRKRIIRVFLEMPRSSVGATCFALASIALITLNVVSLTFPASKNVCAAQDRFGWQTIADHLASFVFTVELLLRTVAASTYLELLNFYYISDFLSVLPAFVDVALQKQGCGRGIRLIKSLRMLRLFKIARANQGFHVISRAISLAMPALYVALFFLVVTVIICATLLFFIEQVVNRGAFYSIPHAMWFLLVTMTTVGYGDVTPTSAPSKCVTVVCMLFGVLFISMPMAVVGNNFCMAWDDKERLFFLQKLNDALWLHDLSTDDLLETTQEIAGGDSLSIRDFSDILNILNINIPNNRLAILWRTLDNNRSGDVDMNEFEWLVRLGETQFNAPPAVAAAGGKAAGSGDSTTEKNNSDDDSDDDSEEEEEAGEDSEDDGDSDQSAATTGDDDDSDPDYENATLEAECAILRGLLADAERLREEQLGLKRGHEKLLLDLGDLLPADTSEEDLLDAEDNIEIIVLPPSSRALGALEPWGAV